METKTVKELCSVVCDCNHSTPPWTEEGKIVVRNFNIKNGRMDLSSPSYTDEATFKKRIEREVPRPGDLIITREAPMGEVAIIPDGVECCLGQRTVLLRADPEICDNHYLLYALQSDYVQKQIFKSEDTGTTVSNLRIPHLERLAIPYVEIEEQHRIVAILKDIDEAYNRNVKATSSLHQMLQTIYDYWFTQFDFPNKEGKPYRQSGGEMVHIDDLDRDIPVGWNVSSLNNTNLFKVIKTGIKKFAGTKRYLATADVNDTDIADGNPINYETRESRANMEPTLLSVWFAKMKDSRKHLFISSAANDFVEHTILSTGFFGLQCQENTFEYVSSYIANPLFEKWKDQISHGATQKAVNGDDLNKILIIEPADDILEQFHEKTKDIFQMLNNIQAENERLAQLRDYLLPLLMSGQVVVNKEGETDD